MLLGIGDGMRLGQIIDDEHSRSCQALADLQGCRGKSQDLCDMASILFMAWA